MEDVLAVYTRPRDPECPLVCLDESSKQLLAETRVPVPMKPGRPARHDYEYERNLVDERRIVVTTKGPSASIPARRRRRRPASPHRQD
jgi:hypothetical protein